MSAFFAGLRNFLISAVTRDKGRKFVALLLAVIVYVFVSQVLVEKWPSMEIEVPVEVKLPEKYGFLSEDPAKVKLTVLTNRTDLSATDFKCKEIVATSDMIQGKKLILQLTPSNFSSSAWGGYKIKKVNPAKLTLPVDRYISKEVRVTPVFNGKLPKNFAVKEIPDQNKPVVTVTALESQLKDVEKVNTEPISLDKITQTFDYFALVVPSSQNTNFQFSPPKVSVKVEVYRKDETRTFRNIDVILFTGKREGSLKAKLVKESAADVVVSGEKVSLGRLKANQVKVFADVSMFDKPGVYQVDLSCWLTENDFKVDSITPKTVQVKVFQ